MANEAQPNNPQSLGQLSRTLMELDDLLVSCMRCGMCQAVCPVYGETFREADVARGKIALLENLAHQVITDAAGVDERINRCLLCGSCQAVCSSGVQVMDIFLRARSIVTGYRGLSPIKKLVFRGMLASPRFFNFFANVGSKFQGLVLRKTNSVVGTCKAPLLKPFIGDRHFPGLANKTFSSTHGSIDTPAGTSGIRVAFFPGCVADKMFTSVAEACLKVFNKHGVGVFMPSGLVCCGIPALASGDRSGYEKLVLDNLKVLAGGEFDYLLTPCATCTSTIKEFWPKLRDNFSAEELRRIDELHEKAMDITQFVVDVLKVETGAPAQGGKVITYHDSCHMKKSLGVTAQPRKLLSALPGYSLKEMPESDRCCGSGGSFTLYHYDLSKQIGQRKLDNILSVKPEMVAAGCPACMMQMMDMISQHGDNIPVKHVIELYADTL